MRSLYGFLTSILIGGFLFLLPVGILLIVLAKLVAYARRAGDVIHARLFPAAAGDLLPTLIAILLLLATGCSSSGGRPPGVTPGPAADGGADGPVLASPTDGAVVLPAGYRPALDRAAVERFTVERLQF